MKKKSTGLMSYLFFPPRSSVCYDTPIPRPRVFDTCFLALMFLVVVSTFVCLRDEMQSCLCKVDRLDSKRYSKRLMLDSTTTVLMWQRHV